MSRILCAGLRSLALDLTLLDTTHKKGNNARVPIVRKLVMPFSVIPPIEMIIKATWLMT